MANARTAQGWNLVHSSKPARVCPFDHDTLASVSPNLAAAMPYGVLEPGLKAAIDLLTREALNAKSAGEIAEGKDAIVAAMEHAHNYQAYMTAIKLLQEQMDRLKRPVG